MRMPPDAEVSPLDARHLPGATPRHDRPRRRRLSAAERRATILEAAIPLFASVGYQQTRMADVAARVGVTEPVIFQNFGTKAELFAAALDRASQHAVAYLERLAEAQPTVHAWLGQLLAPEHLDHLHTAPMFGVLFADAHRLELEPTLSHALQRSIGRTAETMAVILRRGQQQHSIRADVPPLTLAWAVVSLIQARQFRRMQTAHPSQTLESDLVAGVLDAFHPVA